MTARSFVVVFAVVALGFDVTAAQQASGSWRLSDAPLLSLGSREGDGADVFGSIAGAVRLSSGNVVVADGQELQLKFFSSSGVLIKTSGRRGAGPGEFRTIMAPIQRCDGDTVFVYDPGLFRLSVFAPNGDLLRTLDVRKWAVNELPPYSFWCHPSGTLVFVHRSTAPPAGEGPMRPDVRVSVVRPGDSVVSLGTFPSSERYFKDMNAFPRPLGKETTIGVASGSIYVGTADSFAIAAYTLRGERARTMRESRVSRRITPEQVDLHIKGLIARRPGRNASTDERWYRDLKWPAVYPAHGRLLVDALDNLWIEEYPVPGETQRSWTVFDRRGRKTATVSVPYAYRVMTIGVDYVLGVWRDELDVDYVRVYALFK